MPMAMLLFRLILVLIVVRRLLVTAIGLKFLRRQLSVAVAIDVGEQRTRRARKFVEIDEPILVPVHDGRGGRLVRIPTLRVDRFGLIGIQAAVVIGIGGGELLACRRPPFRRSVIVPSWFASYSMIVSIGGWKASRGPRSRSAQAERTSAKPRRMGKPAFIAPLRHLNPAPSMHGRRIGPAAHHSPRINRRNEWRVGLHAAVRKRKVPQKAASSSGNASSPSIGTSSTSPS